MNKVAFITGAGGYIGGETAYTLAKSGIAVAVCDISEESVNKTVERITQNGGTAKGYVADVTESKTNSLMLSDPSRLMMANNDL